MENGKHGICLDCDEEMYEDTETSEHVCESCGKAETIVGEAFDEAQFFNQEVQKGYPMPTKNNLTYFRKILEKFRIIDAVNITIKNGREEYDSTRYRFLGAIINNFGDGSKSVNYACFLYDYFQAVSSNAWQRKEEILELLFPRLPKNSKARRRAKARFHKWWEETIPR